jgi:hypothetical protein
VCVFVKPLQKVRDQNSEKLVNQHKNFFVCQNNAFSYFALSSFVIYVVVVVVVVAINVVVFEALVIAVLFKTVYVLSYS